MSTPFIIVIPARYLSTRLPHKILADIGGKPMIQHVYERACQSGATQVIVATDDPRIQQAVASFGGTVCLTKTTHRSGTERIAEVISQFALNPQQIVVNVQGDEPLINPEHIYQVANNLHENPQAQVATLCEAISNKEALFNPNIVKVVLDQNNFALYFSRAPIAWMRENIPLNHLRHIGIYAYRAGFVIQYVSWPVTMLEQMESLEQLRVLWHGHKIHVARVTASSLPGVDTEQDLLAMRKYFSLQNKIEE